MESVRNKWEDFHSKKAEEGMALEYPDEYVVRFAKRWRSIGGIDKILDMNCGAGRHTALFAELGYEVSGLDISEIALGLAQELLDRKKVSARLVRGFSLNLPFAEADFDGLVAWRALHVFSSEEMKKAVAEMHRVVRPGGRILLSTRSDRNIYDEDRLGKVVHRPNDLSLEELEQLCSVFDVEQIELSEFTSQNRKLRDSYWVASAIRRENRR